MKQIEIYTDGACSGNPGPGGWGAILRFRTAQKVYEKELSGGFVRTTNNRMELLAVIKALEALNRPCEIDLYSDSSYVIKAFNEHWIEGWQRANWRKGRPNEVKNIDLWQRLLSVAAPHKITWNWVKGHAGHPENERCDRLATSAADGRNLQIDPGIK